MLHKRDALWLLALPLYLFVCTVRHELSHVAMAVAEGATVRKIVLWPSWTPEGGFTWGYGGLDGPFTWLTWAAPYACDAATFLCCYLLLRLRPRLPKWLWLNIVIIGLVSPLLNSVYAYVSSPWRPASDVAQLLTLLPHTVVHGFFLAAILCYGYLLASLCSKTRELRGHLGAS